MLKHSRGRWCMAIHLLPPVDALPRCFEPAAAIPGTRPQGSQQQRSTNPAGQNEDQEHIGTPPRDVQLGMRLVAPSTPTNASTP